MRYVLTPGLDRPDMLHREPWDPERCPVEEVIHEEVDHSIAEGMLEAGTAIACRRCGLADRSDPGEIPILMPEPEAEGVG